LTKADIKVSFDESVIKDEIITIIIDVGGLASDIRVRAFRLGGNGLNMTWVQEEIFKSFPS